MLDDWTEEEGEEMVRYGVELFIGIVIFVLGITAAIVWFWGDMTPQLRRKFTKLLPCIRCCVDETELYDSCETSSTHSTATVSNEPKPSSSLKIKPKHNSSKRNKSVPLTHQYQQRQTVNTETSNDDDDDDDDGGTNPATTPQVTGARIPVSQPKKSGDIEANHSSPYALRQNATQKFQSPHNAPKLYVKPPPPTGAPVNVKSAPPALTPPRDHHSNSHQPTSFTSGSSSTKKYHNL